jgi:hypothetical protein
MQKTKFSKINDQFNNLLFGFLSSSWKSKSINVIKGPELNNNYVDCAYLEKYLMTL